jgi:dTDP-L-rhamnose 4-epimerase
MKNTVLVTGGAGFIGSYVTDELISAGHDVRVLDNLSTTTHAPGQRRPKFLNLDAELIIGDLQDSEAVKRALKGVEAVCHLAAIAGVGQSMMDVRSYTTANTLGTAVLMDALIEHPVERLIVASSMNVYGEGQYQRSDGTFVNIDERSSDLLRSGDWEPRDSTGAQLIPVATTEEKPPALTSVYALSKFSQERLCLMLGKEYGIATVVLRIFNTYGPRQFILKPYSGVLSVFASRLINHSSPIIYEDGNQLRDFIHVRDVARVFRLALESDEAEGRIINVGSGTANTVREAACLLARYMKRTNVKLRITGRHRSHDVRHCYADIRVARELLNFDPAVTFDEGIAEMANWLEHRISYDRVTAGMELAS